MNLGRCVLLEVCFSFFEFACFCFERKYNYILYTVMQLWGLFISAPMRNRTRIVVSIFGININWSLYYHIDYQSISSTYSVQICNFCNQLWLLSRDRFQYVPNFAKFNKIESKVQPVRNSSIFTRIAELNFQQAAYTLIEKNRLSTESQNIICYDYVGFWIWVSLAVWCVSCVDAMACQLH